MTQRRSRARERGENRAVHPALSLSPLTPKCRSRWVGDCRGWVRGIFVTEPPLSAGRELPSVQRAPACSSPSFRSQRRAGACPTLPSRAMFLFPFGNVAAAEGPRVAARLLRAVANFLPAGKWSPGLHLAECRENENTEALFSSPLPAHPSTLTDLFRKATGG